jgi:hypothetical protein
MSDHWNFVAAAYAIAALAIGGYWRRLILRERGLKTPTLRGPAARKTGVPK